MVTHTHTEAGRIRNTFEITVRHSTHSNARMREGRGCGMCGHSPLVSVRHMPKCLANCCHCCWRLNRRFWLFSVLSVQLTNCQAKVATHFNSIPTTQLLPRPPCAFTSLALARKVTRKYNRLFLFFPHIFRLVYRATRERNVLHIKFIATQLSQARCRCETVRGEPRKCRPISATVIVTLQSNLFSVFQQFQLAFAFYLLSSPHTPPPPFSLLLALLTSVCIIIQ